MALKNLQVSAHPPPPALELAPLDTRPLLRRGGGCDSASSTTFTIMTTDFDIILDHHHNCCDGDDDDNIMTLEDSFCRDFTCCGLVLDDMHQLLQHYEDCHVQLEEDGGCYSDGEVGDSILLIDAHHVVDDSSWSAFDTSIVNLALASSSSHMVTDVTDDTQISNPLVRRVGDIEDDLGVSVLEWLHEEYERGGKRLRMMTDIHDYGRSSDEEVDVVTVEQSSGAAESSKKDSIEFYDENGSRVDKPYRCSFPGCEKSYKNPNGLKYHNLHGHSGIEDDDSDYAARLMKPYVCNYAQCFKRYKNLNGLKYHIEKCHGFSKIEANQVATDIVKKTNARYGINARSVPAPVLFAAIKEHEEKAKGGAPLSTAVADKEQAIKMPPISLRALKSSESTVITSSNLKPIASPGSGHQQPLKTLYFAPGQLLRASNGAMLPVSQFSLPQTAYSSHSPSAYTNGGTVAPTPTNLSYSPGMPAYFQALAASGLLDMKSYYSMANYVNSSNAAAAATAANNTSSNASKVKSAPSIASSGK
eukprot:Partr_v1_DN24959_c0_g1_i1_m45294 putative JAZF zinc finger 1